MNGLDTSTAFAHADSARIAQATRLPKPGQMDLHRMRETAQEFEAVYLSEMLRPMFENIDAAEPFGGGPGEQAYRDMQIDEYGKAIAKAGGIGLADSVMREMIKMQESN